MFDYLQSTAVTLFHNIMTKQNTRSLNISRNYGNVTITCTFRSSKAKLTDSQTNKISKSSHAVEVFSPILVVMFI